MRDFIKNYFNGYSKRGIINGFSKFIKNNPKAEKYLNNILIENPNWENIRNIVYEICFDEQLKKCKNCGKEMKYSKRKRNNGYCSLKCAASSKEVQEKYKRTNLEKYGTKHPMQSKEIRKKVKQTCLEKYGCVNPAQNKEVQDKIKQTCLERYNVEYPLKSKEVQKKANQTFKKRYGCENPFQSEKVKQIHYNKSYDNFILSFVKYGITPLFSKEEYEGYDKIYKWKCLICGNIFESRIYPTSHIKECPYLPHCWNCYPRMSGESRAEIELLDFVKQYFPNAHKDKKIIKPYELDIVIPELKLAIEFNGDYWHSAEFKSPGFHLNKILETNKKGYRLIHIWENEWINNPEEIQNKLKDILEGKEDLNFAEDKLILDRSWYNNIEIPGYELVEELPPEMINRNGFDIENCGYLIYERIN